MMPTRNPSLESPYTLLQISAGTGPIEVRIFVAKLAAMLSDLCRTRGLHVLDVATIGDPDAPRSIGLRLSGDTRAMLADMVGTHALIAPNRKRGQRARKRWFAGVSLHDSAPKTTLENARATVYVFDPRDLEITAARASGPGGQNVNRRASAVRVYHRPTGISVRSSQERSQHANRKLALARLRQILQDRAQATRAHKRAQRRNAHYRFERGNPVKTWHLAAPAGGQQSLTLAPTTKRNASSS